jgi:hypothetical protein
MKIGRNECSIGVNKCCSVHLLVTYSNLIDRMLSTKTSCKCGRPHVYQSSHSPEMGTAPGVLCIAGMAQRLMTHMRAFFNTLLQRHLVCGTICQIMEVLILTRVLWFKATDEIPGGSDSNILYLIEFYHYNNYKIFNSRHNHVTWQR